MAYQSYPQAQQLPQGPIFHPPPSPPDTMAPKSTRQRTSNERNTPPYPLQHAQGPHPPQLPPDAQLEGQVNFYASAIFPSGAAPLVNGAPQPPNGGPPTFLTAPPPGVIPTGPGGAPLPVIYTQAPYLTTATGAPGTPPSSSSPSTGGSLPSAPPRSPSEAGSPGGIGSNHYAPSTSVPRLPPILQVEKQQVTTTATQAASASRRRNEAHFICPVPGCGSTFTRRFNLRGEFRSGCSAA